MEGQGPPNRSRNPGRSRKCFSGRAWGETALPKGLLGTIQSIPLLQNPVQPHGGPFLPQNHLFPGPIFGQKRSPAQLGSKFGIGVPKIAPGVENTKVVCRKNMQKTVVGIPNGAICCKLWPKTIPALLYQKGWIWWQGVQEAAAQESEQES